MTYLRLAGALDGAEIFTDGDWVESKDQDPNGDVRLIQLADVGLGRYVDKSARFMTSEKATELKCTYLRPGDVLVARMPDPLGRACIYPGDEKPGVTVVDVCIIRPDPESVDARWLMHWLNAPKTNHQIERSATGTTRKRISRGNLGELPLALPPIEEQRQIAAVLDAADALRAKRRQALTKLDTLTQAIFIDMFGDLGMYDRVPFGSLLTQPLRNGISPSKAGSVVGDVFSLSAITGAAFDATAVKKSTFRVAHSPDKTVSSEDFLICRGNGNVALVGRGKYPEMSLPEVAFPDTMIAARCDHGSISRGFLDHIWDRSIIRRQLEGAARTTNGTHKVNQTMIESVQIPLPSVGTQENFDRARASIGAQRARVLRCLDGIQTLLVSLQQRAFRGEL